MTMLKLVPATGTPVEVTQDSVLIGRDPACEIVLTDGSVSRKHARIEQRGDDWCVVDQGSANGTFVDNERVTETTLLDGQELRFGAVPYHVEIDDDASGATVLTAREQVTPGEPGPTQATPVAAGPPPARVAPPPLPGRTPGRPVAAGELPPATPRAKRSPWLWVGGGCCGCIVIVLLATAGIVGYSWKKSSAATGVVEQLVVDLNKGDQQAAYGCLSRSYQDSFPPEQFAAWIETHPGLARNAHVSRIGYQSGTGGTQVTLLLTAASGEQERATFGLVTEDGRLKIASIHFETDSTSP
jgi:pSer/pThr/pTyr-binding forkhead associated (FHA) protein